MQIVLNNATNFYSEEGFRINEETKLIEDLNYDSVDLIQLVVEIESRFNIEFDPSDILIEKLNRFSDLTSIKSDCTNYVSQCLSNGGIALRPMYGKQIQIQDIDSVKVTDVQYFFCGEYTRSDTSGVLTKTGFVSSSTWSCVDSQNYNYSAGCFKMGLVQELSSRRATITCYSLKSDSDKKKFTRTVKVGDVVQFRRKGKKAYSHSAIVGKVTSRNSTSKNVYFYSHSSTRTASANDNFWTMIGQGDLSAYDEIKIIHLGNSFK